MGNRPSSPIAQTGDEAPRERDEMSGYEPVAIFPPLSSSPPLTHPNPKSSLSNLTRIQQRHPLNSTTIRVISVLPSNITSGPNPIQCTMRTIPLSAHYEALSYECHPPRSGALAFARLRRLGRLPIYTGSAADAERELFASSCILIDGLPVEVPWNLHSALWHIRDSSPIPRRGNPVTAYSRTLWIDMLCISQEDDEEKEREIKRMKDIYSRCAWVLIWLGEASDMSDDAMDWFNAFFAVTSDSDELDVVNELIVSFYRDRKPWNDLAGSLLNSSYWTRLWTVQEIALASEALVMCGSKKMLWYRFMTIIAASMKGRLKMYTRAAELPVFTAAAGIRTGINPRIALGLQAQQKKFPYIRELAADFSEYGTSHPHDRIFGLLGLAKDANTLGLEVSYKVDIATLYTEFSRLNILKYQDLDFTFSHRNLYRSERLPSWVLDLSCPPRSCVYPNLNRLPGTGSAFHTDKGLSKPEFRFQQLSTGLALHLRGMPIDEIMSLGESYMPEKSNNAQYLHGIDPQQHYSSEDYLRSLELEAKRIAYDYPSYDDRELDVAGDGNYLFTFQSKKIALSQTLCYGLDWAGFPITDDNGVLNVPAKLPSSSRPDLNYQARCEAWKEDMWMWKIFYWTGRRVMRSMKGYMGLVPKKTREGDMIFVVPGASEPLILRAEGDKWVFIGSCYIHGIMMGEAPLTPLRNLTII